MRKIKAWAVKDCTWGTYRGIYLTKKEALENEECPYCGITEVIITEIPKKKKP